VNFKKLLDEIDPDFKSNNEICGGFKAYVGDHVVIVCSILDDNQALVHPLGKDTHRVVIGLNSMKVLEKDIDWVPKKRKSVISRFLAHEV
jgi:hypothetical protein